jgi:RNA polymerase sigma-70 factor (TIGR02960 family)
MTVLDQARAGDQRAFQELVEPYRRELHLHCYRLLGSFTDAEDVLQEILLAAWRGLPGFAARASLRTWLYRIATHRCLNALRAGARRGPAEPAPPFRPPAPTRRTEITWLQPYPDAWLDEVPDEAPGPEARYGQRESVELAFVAGLQRLPPRQAATLVLRDVLGYSNAEVAELLDTTETAVKGALQRARAAVAHPAAPGSEPDHVRALSRQFADAFVARDLDRLLGLLTDEAWLAMPPAPHEYVGPAAIASFLRVSSTWQDDVRVRLVATGANRQPAFGCYLGSVVGQPAGILVLTVHSGLVAGVTRFLDDAVFERFALPHQVRFVQDPGVRAGVRSGHDTSP